MAKWRSGSQKALHYLLVHRSTELPDITHHAPFKAVICVEEAPTPDRQREISEWLVAMGCRYVMTLGENCEAWCDSVRKANLARHDIGTMDECDFVMTTGHPNESLRVVFWYAKKAAKHPKMKLSECVVLHLADRNRAAEYEMIYRRA